MIYFFTHVRLHASRRLPVLHVLFTWCCGGANERRLLSPTVGWNASVLPEASSRHDCWHCVSLDQWRFNSKSAPLSGFMSFDLNLIRLESFSLIDFQPATETCEIKLDSTVSRLQFFSFSCSFWMFFLKIFSIDVWTFYLLLQWSANKLEMQLFLLLYIKPF